MTTVDLQCPSGKMIPIEERNAAEVKGVKGSFGDIVWAPKEAHVYNPAFDVTDNALIAGIVAAIAALIAVAIISGVSAVGSKLSTSFDTVQTSLK